MESQVEGTLDRPSTMWTPPSREEMLRKLGAPPPKSDAEHDGKGGRSGLDSEGAKADKSSSLQRAGSQDTGSTHSSREPPTSQAGIKGASAGAGDAEKDDGEFDLLIVGGGATGAGVALDAAARGLKVGMVERDDFSSGTSSKSTKLVHGGVRYLQKAVFELDYEQYKLVKEALHERKTFLHTAPYLSHHLPIMLPVYTWWQIPYFFAGTKLYDILAGSANMESSYVLGKGKALEAFPMLKKDGLTGAVVYYDGQHNDSRMNVALVMTAVQYGAVAANHTEVTSLIKDGEGRVKGAKMRDVLTGREWETKAKGVINATGPFSDAVRQMDDGKAPNLVAPASGVHITLPNYYAPAKIGLIDPATSDGRVIFFLPWQGNTIAGTTDSPAKVEQHPIPKEEEIEWILNEVRNYLSPDIRVRRGDVLSAWSGLRPLVKDPNAKDTQSLVRNHLIHVSESGLLTIAGGKWTTYRAMAEETVDRAVKEYNLKPKRGCITKDVQLVGSQGWSPLMFIKLIQQFGLEVDVARHLSETYGDRSWGVCAMAPPTGLRFPTHGNRLDATYPYIDAEVTWACRREYAATAVDVIARRTRLSFLNAEAALESLPQVIDIMSKELGWTEERRNQEFSDATKFLRSMGLSEKRLATLTLDDVRNGRHRERLAIEDDLLARTVFTPEELETLKKRFAKMDANNDGKIDPADLSRTMSKLGFDQIDERTVRSILNEVDVDRDGQISLEEYLDVAAGSKEVHLHNAFTDIAFPRNHGVTDDALDGAGDEGKNRSGGNEPPKKEGEKIDYSNKTPPERTGGSCPSLRRSERKAKRAGDKKSSPARPTSWPAALALLHARTSWFPLAAWNSVSSRPWDYHECRLPAVFSCFEQQTLSGVPAARTGFEHPRPLGVSGPREDARLVFARLMNPFARLHRTIARLQRLFLKVRDMRQTLRASSKQSEPKQGRSKRDIRDPARLEKVDEDTSLQLLNLVIDYAVPPPTQQGGPAHYKACEQLSLVHRTWTRQAQRQLYSTFYGSWPRPDPPYWTEAAEVRDTVKWRKERTLAWVEQAGRLGVKSWSAVLRIRAESVSYRGKKYPDRGTEYVSLEWALPPVVLCGMRTILVDADSHAYGFDELNPDDYSSLVSLSFHSGEVPRALSHASTPHLTRLELTAMCFIDSTWPATLPNLQTLVLRFCAHERSKLPRGPWHAVRRLSRVHLTDQLFDFAPQLRNLAIIDSKTNISRPDALGWMRRTPTTLERLFLSTHNLKAVQVSILLAALTKQLAHLPRQIWLQALDDALFDHVDVDEAEVGTFKAYCKKRRSTFMCNEPWMDFEGRGAEEVVRRW
ncbi:putative Glycerol-3-phosphate dehydrogenase [Rhodotorula toruloides ATCC 204091]|nr:putative Glycerol-3-phosphate dehydrogenase [Rhodotorula toruloides ATCC 204091]